MGTTTAPTGDLKLSFPGVTKAVNFRHAISKGEKSYWGVLSVKGNGERFLSRYGVKVSPLAGKLPTSVHIVDPATDQSIEVKLTKGQTQDGREKVSASQKVTLPNGEERMLNVSISRTKDAQWNIRAVASNLNAGAPTFDVEDL